MKKSKYTSIFFFVFIPVFLFAQGEINTEESKIFFQNARTGGLTISSNGFGADFRIGNRIDGFKKNLYEFGFDILKHPKETRSDSYYLPAATYIYGKTNVCFNLRASIGREKEIFSRHDKGGIAIRLHYVLGGNIAVLKPIYYEVFVRFDNRTHTYITEDQKFDGVLRQNIYSKSSFFKGFKEISFNPGGFVKAGASFDFATQANTITSLEAGVILDAFLQKLDLMYTEDNPRFMLSLYLSYRVGVIVSARKRNLSEERKKELYGY